MTLIYSDKYRGWGKRKPPQWGPLSAVKTAVWDYYENKLGIAAPVIYLPLMGNTGDSLVNVGSQGVPGALINGQWGSTARSITLAGEQNDANTDRISVGSPTYLFGYAKTTFFFRGKKTDNAELNGLSSRGLASSSTLRWLISDDERVTNERIEFATYSGSWHAVQWSGSHLKYGEEDSLYLTWDAATTLELFLSGASVGTKSFDAAYFPTSLASIIIGAGNATTASSNFWGFKGDIYSFGFFTDKLTPDQIAKDADSPYAAIMPRSIPSYFFISAGGGGTPETLYPDSAGLALAGQTAEINARTVILLASASIALTGNALLLGEPETLYPGSTAISLAGSNLSLNEILHPDGGGASLTGQPMKVNAQERILLDGAGVQYTGRPLKINELLKLDAATIRYIGKTLVWPTTGKTAPGKLRMGHSLRLR